MRIHRLHPDDAYSWQLYPAFEARVRVFLSKYCPNRTEAQDKEFFTELRQRWTVTPQLAGYWIAIESEAIVAHVCGWIQTYYSRPYILCFQAESDEMWKSREALQRIYAQAREWKDELNKTLVAANQPTIDYIEQWTFHDHSADTWNRLFPDIKQAEVFRVMRFPI